jgi:hypothetical protein
MMLMLTFVASVILKLDWTFAASGGSFDSTARGPVPGLELMIGTVAETSVHDTVVMANLGYYQLKAQPGVWFVRLADGRASWLYELADGQSQKVRRLWLYESLASVCLCYECDTDTDTDTDTIDWYRSRSKSPTSIRRTFHCRFASNLAKKSIVCWS